MKVNARIRQIIDDVCKDLPVTTVAKIDSRCWSPLRYTGRCAQCDRLLRGTCALPETEEGKKMIVEARKQYIREQIDMLEQELRELE